MLTSSLTSDTTALCFSIHYATIGKRKYNLTVYNTNSSDLPIQGKVIAQFTGLETQNGTWETVHISSTCVMTDSRIAFECEVLESDDNSTASNKSDTFALDYIDITRSNDPCSSTTESITTKKVTTTKPTTQKPTTPKPTTPKPITRKPTTSKPTISKLTTPKPITSKPTTQEQTTPKPTTLKLNTPKPVTTTPITPKLLTSKPTTTTPKPVTPKPTTPKPVTPKPTTPKPVTPTPIIIKPTTLKAVTSKPTTQKPTTPNPTTPTPKPVTQKPITKTPTTPNPTAPIPTTKKPTTPKPTTQAPTVPQILPLFSCEVFTNPSVCGITLFPPASQGPSPWNTADGSTIRPFKGNDYIFFDDRMKETSEDDEDDEDDEALESGSEDKPSGTEASISFPEVENTGRGCLSLQYNQKGDATVGVVIKVAGASFSTMNTSHATHGEWTMLHVPLVTRGAFLTQVHISSGHAHSVVGLRDVTMVPAPCPLTATPPRDEGLSDTVVQFIIVCGVVVGVGLLAFSALAYHSRTKRRSSQLPDTMGMGDNRFLGNDRTYDNLGADRTYAKIDLAYEETSTGF